MWHGLSNNYDSYHVAYQALLRMPQQSSSCSGLLPVSIAGVGEVQHREGHRGLHQEGVRQEIQPHLALHRWQECECCPVMCMH